MKFATILSTAFVLILLKTGYSQKEKDYIKYYNLCNTADSLYYFKNYKEAIQNYQAAFKTVDFVHAKNLKNTSNCASKLNQNEVAWQYTKRAILGGENDNFLKNSFPKNISKESLKDSINLFKNQHQKSLNQFYIKEIDSLYYIDQNLIRGNKTVKSSADFSKLVIPVNRFELDQSVWNHLIGLMNIYGFPSEKNIGPKAYEQVSIILHHHFKSPQNNQEISLAIEALKKGEYMPYHFALIYDYSYSGIRKTPFLYFANFDPSKLSSKEILEVEQRRKDFGIKPFSAYKIKVRGKYLDTISLW